MQHLLDCSSLAKRYAANRPPCPPLYLVRLIHQATGRAFPGERLWTAQQLGQPATLGFPHLRNREGCDIYFQPFAGNQNAGYILVDLDAAQPAVLQATRHNGHEPCVVLQSSRGVLTSTHLLRYAQGLTSAEFKRWLEKHGCSFEPGKGGHLHVRRGEKRSVLRNLGLK